MEQILWPTNSIPLRKNMRVPAKSVHALDQNKFGNLQPMKPGTKLHAGKSSYKTNTAQVDRSIRAGSKARRPTSGRSHPTAKTGVAKCTARSHGTDSPYRQRLLPTAPNRSNPIDVITISDDSEDESGPDDFELRSEYGDHLSAVNGDDKIDHQGGKRSTSSEHISW